MKGKQETMKVKRNLIQTCLLGLALLSVASPKLSAQMIQNPSFETPVVGSVGEYFSYESDPAGAVWTFVGQAGIAANGSGYAYYNGGTPGGNQFAFLQGISGVGGSMSQTITNCPAGNYTFNFIASQRDIAGRDNTTNQTAIVLVDGVNVGSFTPPDTNWYSYQTTPLSLNAGNHVLTFTNVPVAGDATVRVDAVGLQWSGLAILGIASYGNQSVLFWPASATNVVLQTTTNLSSPNWVTVSNGTPFIAVGVTNSFPAQFFRLH
jgi:hypothetical protein